MPCTTLLVGKDASYDGAPMIARNEDSAQGEFNPKRFVVVHPDEQPRSYTSVIGKRTIELPDDPMRYTSMPNAITSNGVWGEAGVNAANVAMSATETLTTNERVLGADPFVELQPAADGHAAVPGGIGEEDFLTIVLPYIHTAREGVERLGALLEEHGTYEMNGVAFSDAEDIWWLETVGGHHWIAKRVPDDCYVTMPNQLGIDDFDLDDALGAKKECMCSADMREFLADNHLDLGFDGDDAHLDARAAFGSHSDTDHVYNTPRAWYMQRLLNPHDGMPGVDEDIHDPEDDDIPWARRPERKVTVEDVKRALSSHYQGTPYDPYGKRGTKESRSLYRVIGINRQSELSLMEVRPDKPAAWAALQWVSFGSNPFNTIEPFYANIETTPDYLSGTTARVSTEQYYWANRVIGALCDAHFNATQAQVARYQQKTLAYGHAMVAATDKALDGDAAVQAAGADATDNAAAVRVMEKANEALAQRLKDDTDKLLDQVLYAASMHMDNGFFLSDD